MNYKLLQVYLFAQSLTCMLQLWEADKRNVHGRDRKADHRPMYFTRLSVQWSALRRTQYSSSFLHKIRVRNWEVLQFFYFAFT